MSKALNLLTFLLSLTFAPAWAYAKSDPGVFSLQGFQAPVYYEASGALEEGSDAETVIVLIHGWSGGVARNGVAAELQQAIPESFVIAPRFPTMQALERHGMERDDRAIWNDSWPSDLAKPGLAADDWRGGGDADACNFSSFDVIDAIFAILGDKDRFPALKRVVLTGFSAGGQFVGRYVAVGRGKVRRGVTVEYVLMSPSTQFRFDPQVPWHYGLANRPRYSAELSEKRIMKNLCSRRVWMACGDADVQFGSGLDKTDAAMLQGRSRYERYLNFQEYVSKYPKWASQLSFHTFEGLAHDSKEAYRDQALICFLKGKPGLR